MTTHRPLIMGRRGAVGANHPLAAQAGLDTLRAGGNAFDAAVATSLALGVVEPMMSGLGGDGFYHCFIAATGAPVVWNATGPAPRASGPAGFADVMPVHGPRSVSVPGLVGGLAAMHAELGRLPWAQLVQPAIGLAREGFAATRHCCRYTADARDRLAADPLSAAVFLPGGIAPALGAWIAQPALARTLEELADGGTEAFYRGGLARRLAQGMAERGVPITLADLEAYAPERVQPIGIDYRGLRVLQTPPNSTGFVVLQMLRIAERFDVADPAERIHVLVEAKKRAFLDRERFGADPRGRDVPIDVLLSDAAIDAHAAAIRLDRAAEIDLTAAPAHGGDTTYFAVADDDGNAVSAIQSINSAYGSGVMAGGTGVLLNNRMAYWHLAEGHPNRLRAGLRVRHTMNAPMVLKDGRVWALFGTPGADHQVQVNAQVALALIDDGRDPQAALEQPRWSHSQPGQDANWPHGGDGRLTIEEDFGPGVLAALERRGHRLARVPHLGGPCAEQAIRVLDGAVLAAGSDPRRDGWAAAW